MDILLHICCKVNHRKIIILSIHIEVYAKSRLHINMVVLFLYKRKVKVVLTYTQISQVSCHRLKNR